MTCMMEPRLRVRMMGDDLEHFSIEMDQFLERAKYSFFNFKKKIIL